MSKDHDEMGERHRSRQPIRVESSRQ